MSDDFLGIVAETKENLNKALKRASVDVAVELQKDFNMSLNQFYDAYHPRRYKRTYSTYKASSGNDASGHFVNPRKLITGGDGSYTITLTVDGGRVPEGAYAKEHPTGKNLSATDIFYRVWDEGIHGFTEDEIDAFYKEQLHWTIPPKTTPPDVVMDQRFAKTGSGEHLGSIVSKYLKI